MKPLGCGTSRSKVRSTSKLALLVLGIAFLKIRAWLDETPTLDGKMQEERREESAGKERTSCKKDSSPSKEVARAVVSLLDRSSRLGPQLPKGKVQAKVLIRGAPGRKEELITPVPTGRGCHVATQAAQAIRGRNRSSTLTPLVQAKMVTNAWDAGPVGLKASRVSWRGEQWWVCRLPLRTTALFPLLTPNRLSLLLRTSTSSSKTPAAAGPSPSQQQHQLPVGS